MIRAIVVAIVCANSLLAQQRIDAGQLSCAAQKVRQLAGGGDRDGDSAVRS